MPEFRENATHSVGTTALDKCYACCCRIGCGECDNASMWADEIASVIRELIGIACLTQRNHNAVENTWILLINRVNIVRI